MTDEERAALKKRIQERAVQKDELVENNTVPVVKKEPDEHKLNVMGLLGFACAACGVVTGFVFSLIGGIVINIVALILSIVGYYQEKNDKHVKYDGMMLVYLAIIISSVSIWCGSMYAVHVHYEQRKAAVEYQNQVDQYYDDLKNLPRDEFMKKYWDFDYDEYIKNKHK